MARNPTVRQYHQIDVRLGLAGGLHKLQTPPIATIPDVFVDAAADIDGVTDVIVSRDEADSITADFTYTTDTALENTYSSALADDGTAFDGTDLVISLYNDGGSNDAVFLDGKHRMAALANQVSSEHTSNSISFSVRTPHILDVLEHDFW